MPAEELQMGWGVISLYVKSWIRRRSGKYSFLAGFIMGGGISEEEGISG